MNAEKENLARYGWDEAREAEFEEYARQGLDPGRVVLEFNQFHRVFTESGEVLAEVAGRLRHEAACRADLPAVGDWVALRRVENEEKAVISAILLRRSKFARKTKGAKTEEQIVGANIDAVFLVTSLNQDFNIRRLERSLAIAWESSARPVIILTKTDLCENVEEKFEAVQAIAAGVPIHAVCAIQGEGMSELRPYFVPGQTVALIGSSGVGKSTLINALLGFDRQFVKQVREHDDRGLHTTRHRELISLPSGGLVLDTPGMRELQLWDSDEGIETTFDDIEELAPLCHFTDCRHENEPRCAVRAAVADGRLLVDRLENYLKMHRELADLARRQDALAQKNERSRWKKLSRLAEERAKSKRGGNG
ncbi:MAG: ribosome small subunit-dependent GTPase A [Blastocatellia bacterium]